MKMGNKITSRAIINHVVCVHLFNTKRAKSMVGLIEVRLEGFGEVKRVSVTDMFDKQWVGSTFYVDQKWADST
jgi:hypothetical protein